MEFEDARVKNLSVATTTDLQTNSSLEVPLLLPFEDTDETPSDLLGLRGRKKATTLSSSSSSSPRSIGGAPSNSRGIHGNIDLEAPGDEDCCTEIAEHGDEEVVGPLVDEENNNNYNNNSMWRRLGQAMVGRWGSIRTTHQQSWLHWFKNLRAQRTGYKASKLHISIAKQECKFFMTLNDSFKHRLSSDFSVSSYMSSMSSNPPPPTHQRMAVACGQRGSSFMPCSHPQEARIISFLYGCLYVMSCWNLDLEPIYYPRNTWQFTSCGLL